MTRHYCPAPTAHVELQDQAVCGAPEDIGSGRFQRHLVPVVVFALLPRALLVVCCSVGLGRLQCHRTRTRGHVTAIELTAAGLL